MCQWVSKGKECFLHKKGLCKFSHDVPGADAVKGKDQQTVQVKAVSVSVRALGVAGSSDDDVESKIGKRAVLVGSGANEVLRPFNRGWWNEIV